MMKKLGALMMALALTALSLATCLPAMAAGGATLVLNVSYDKNLQFSIYDADIYVDDLFVGTILQGEDKSYEITDLSIGTAHTICFYKTTDHSLHGGTTNQLEFTLDGDSEISCTIHAHWYGVLLTDHSQSGAESSGLPTADACTFSYRIDYEPNLAMAKYPIEMYIDDGLIATLSNGCEGSGSMQLSGGAHTLTFYKQGGHSISESIEFSLTGDASFECSLKSHMSYIEVKGLSTNATLK